LRACCVVWQTLVMRFVLASRAGLLGPAVALVLAACGTPAPTPDVPDQRDAFADQVLPRTDAPAPFEGGLDVAPRDGSPPPDASSDAVPPVDAPFADAPGADGGPGDGGAGSAHVHIFIDSMCRVSVSPTQIDAPVGAAVQVTYHNHSTDFVADVWNSYGGGFLGLASGAEWFDRYMHCAGTTAHTDWADISIAGGGTTACPAFRFKINCI
jgi:hypothetical protein